MPDLNIMPPSTKPAAKPAKPNPAERIRELLTDRDTFGTVLLVIVLDTFGMECLHDADEPERGAWHPSTFRQEIQQKFGVSLPQCNLDKLLAAVMVFTTDVFYKDVAAFIHLANVLAGDEFDPGTWDKADSVECAWAITEALLLSPPDEDEPFSDEIRHYISAVLADEGYVTPPDVLRIAIGGDLSSKVRYDFADDPEMFKGIYETQQAKTAEVEDTLLDALTRLRMQLSDLPLQHGSTVEIEKQIDKILQQRKKQESFGPEHVL